MSILICYDGSPSAKRSLRIAHELLDGVPAVLLHVWSSPDRVSADAFSTTASDTGPSGEVLDESARKRAVEILSEGRGISDRLGVAVTTLAERNRSTVPNTILEVAAELEAELIVTGTHGTTAVQSDLLGSVSNALVRGARRPVLIVPGDRDRG